MSDKCPDCGKKLYPSPSPNNVGKLEHFCPAVNGMVIEPGTVKVESPPETKKKSSK